ncbi:CrpP family ICE-associated protein [Stutzerimonas stutzeri]
MNKPSSCADNRRFNNPHKSIYEAGRLAAQAGLPVHRCPHLHPPMRSSWLRGFAAGQQLDLFLD